MLNFDKLPRFKKDQFQIFEMIPRWAEAFETSEAALIRQLSWAHGWIDCNPRKAPKNVPRFLWNWMRRAKQMGTLVEGGQMSLKERPADDPEPDMTIEEMIEIRKKNMSRSNGSYIIDGRSKS